MAKTGAERQRAYRSRLKKSSKPKKIPKSAAQRQREYRTRVRLLKDLEACTSDLQPFNRSSYCYVSAMSCVNSTNKFSEPQIIKIDNSEDNLTASGKPCIDFQPDDRWQIKDDEKNDNVMSNSTVNELKNGRQSRRLRNSRSNDSNSAINGEALESGSDSESKIKVDPDEPSETVDSSKRKREPEAGNMPDCNTTKKVKLEEKPSKCEKDVGEDSSDKITMPNLSPATSDITPKSPEDTKDNLDVSIEIVESDNSQEVAEVSEVKEEKRDCDSLPTLEEIKTDDDISEVPNNTSVNGTDLINDSEIEIININDDKKSDSDESDSEIQIINPDELINKASADFLSGPVSDVHYTLTAGFPYYNSLKEKIPNFKAGEYKPVKFPHTGTLLLGESEVIIESPSLLVPLLIKESDEFPKTDTEEKKVNGSDPTMMLKPNISRRNFFQSSVGQFLINLGTSRVQEWYHRDMKRTKLKQLKSAGGKNEEIENSVKTHDKRHEELKLINAAFNFRMHHCKFCDFRSESLTVMEGHFLIPHVTGRREYKCNFCKFLTRDPGAIVKHYDEAHKKKAILDSYIPFHECIFCSFQSHLKNKVNAHMNRCRKHFIPSQNLSPPFDFEFPGVTTKPVTINDVIGHRRLLLSSAKNPRMPGPEDNQNALYARKKLASVLTKLSNQNVYPDLKNASLMKQLMSPQTQISTISAANLHLPPGLVITRPRGQVPQIRAAVGRFQGPQRMPLIRGVPPRRGPPYTTNISSTASQLASSGISITPVNRGNSSPATRTNNLPGAKNVTLTPIGTATNRTVSQKPGPPQPVALFTNMAGPVGQPQARLPANMQLRAIRPAAPYQRLNTPPSQVVKGSAGNTFVVCEICDSYIKDLEELRTHMNWVHKVKIHPKMLVSRPPLNCQKCHWRFFTDQGLERHLLGAHGLVTTNMQEMANKNQDGGRCIICGAVFTYKLVSHMTQVHKVTLKPAHLSYKCTVCTATFTLYRLFESHVYNVHSGAAKRSAEDASSSEPPAKKSSIETGPRKCRDCGFVTENLHDHIIKKHMKNCGVKLCHIEKCEKCLNSSDEMLVITMADFGIDDGLESDDGDSSEEESADENDTGDNSTANSKDDKEESSKTGDEDKSDAADSEKVGSEEPS